MKKNQYYREHILLRLILSLIVFLGQQQIFAQDDLEAVVQDATLDQQCNNGEINLTIVGGFAPYEYSWSSDTGVPSGYQNEDLNNLSPGEYCVTVTDALCGVATQCFEINCCPAIPNPTIQYYCNPAGEGYVGSIYLVFPLVIPHPYPIITWYNSKGQFVGFGSFLRNVPIDTYTAVFGGTDSECTTVRTYSFGITPLTASLLQLNNISDCGVTTDGYAYVKVSGGQPPYTLNWDGEGTFVQNYAKISQVGQNGVYVLNIIDNNGCELNFPVEICCCDNATCFNPEDEVIGVASEIVGVTNGNNGSIDLTVHGGMGNYLFFWSNGSRDEDIVNLAPGEYSVTITDGCNQQVHEFTIRDCNSEPILMNVDITNACSSWNNTGEIDIVMTAGEEPFTYEWGSGITENTPNLTDLPTGEYCVTITDGGGCKNNTCFFVDDISNSDPPILDFDAVLGPIGESRGAILLNATGEEEYSYLWSNGLTTPNIYNLEQGPYTVTISNSVGCQLSEYIFLIGISCGIFPPPVLEAKNNDQYAGYGYPCDETNGIGGILIEEISSGFPPYTLVIEKEVDYEEFEIISTTFFDEAVNNYVIPNLTRDRYRVSVTDVCGKSAETLLIDLCNHCGYTYDTEDEVIKLYDEFNSSDEGILLELKCTCSQGCFLQFPRIDIDVKQILPMVSTLAFPGENFTVGPSSWNDPQPDNRHYITDMNFNIEVSRDDGCEFSIPIYWNDEEQHNVIFHDDGFGLGGAGFVLSNGKIIDDYFFGNYKCQFCNPLDEGGVYSEDDGLCTGHTSSSVAIFELDPPDDYLNPCYNGGTIKAYKLVDGVAILDNTFELPLNLQPVDVISTDWVGKIGVSEVCEFGGGCVYEAEDIFPDLDIELSKDILVTWCKESYSIPDGDNDGIPDEYDPCPNEAGVDCDDPVFPGGGNPDDCTVEPVEGLDCVYEMTCDGNTELITGSYNYSIFGGWFSPLECYYCFEAEYCEFITETGELMIEFIEDPVSQILVTEDPEGPVCDPSYPSSCNVKIYCDQNLNTLAEPSEVIGTVCHPDCDGPEYLWPYLPLCNPPSYYYVLNGITFTGGDDSIEVRSYSLDKEMLRQLIHDKRMEEIGKMNKKSIPSYKLFPNPTTNYLILENQNPTDNEVIVIIENLFGQQVVRRNVLFPGVGSRELFDVTFLAASHYVFRVFDLHGNQISLDKFIKI
jgi:hypothetical protein